MMWKVHPAVRVLVQVSLVQADNFSWFGYPDDTEPSARNLLPGLAKAMPLLPFSALELIGLRNELGLQGGMQAGQQCIWEPIPVVLQVDNSSWC